MSTKYESHLIKQISRSVPKHKSSKDDNMHNKIKRNQSTADLQLWINKALSKLNIDLQGYKTVPKPTWTTHAMD